MTGLYIPILAELRKSRAKVYIIAVAKPMPGYQPEFLVIDEAGKLTMTRAEDLTVIDESYLPQFADELLWTRSPAPSVA